MTTVWTAPTWQAVRVLADQNGLGSHHGSFGTAGQPTTTLWAQAAIVAVITVPLGVASIVNLGASPLAPTGLVFAALLLGFFAYAAMSTRNRERRDSRAGLHLFEQGLVLELSDEDMLVFEWATVRVYQLVQAVNGSPTYAAYTLFAPDGTAITIGRGGSPTGVVDGVPADEIRRGPAFIHEGQWGPVIQRGIAEAQLPGIVAAIASGESARFGKFTLDSAGATIKRRLYPWSRVGELELLNGTVWLHASGSTKSLMTSGIDGTPNVLLLKELIDHHRVRADPGLGRQ